MSVEVIKQEPEQETEQTLVFTVTLKSYGKFSKVRHDLALRLCRTLYTVLGGRFAVSIDGFAVKYEPSGEGGSVKFVKSHIAIPQRLLNKG